MAETTCCAAVDALEAVEAVTQSEPTESTARAAEVAADASLAAFEAALAACATRVAADSSLGAAAASELAARLSPPPMLAATMASCMCCVAMRSSRASSALDDAFAAMGAAAEDAEVAAAAAVDAAAAAAMTSAVWLLGTPARIACVAIAAARRAAPRAFDADASAADRPTLLPHGPSAHSVSLRSCDVGMEKYAPSSMRTFQTLPSSSIAAAVAYSMPPLAAHDLTSTRSPTRSSSSSRRSMLRYHRWIRMHETRCTSRCTTWQKDRSGAQMAISWSISTGRLSRLVGSSPGGSCLTAPRQLIDVLLSCDGQEDARNSMLAAS
mmetsp:Transcript_130/g.408  ORF Transcript_130/g.408 Transcript_130/m.408 type:complete len:324 (-) Transcript_130:110-1081(-)